MELVQPDAQAEAASHDTGVPIQSVSGTGVPANLLAVRNQTSYTGKVSVRFPFK